MKQSLYYNGDPHTIDLIGANNMGLKKSTSQKAGRTSLVKYLFKDGNPVEKHVQPPPRPGEFIIGV